MKEELENEIVDALNRAEQNLTLRELEQLSEYVIDVIDGMVRQKRREQNREGQQNEN